MSEPLMALPRGEKLICSTCGESKQCRRCAEWMMHVHYTTGEGPDWMHWNRRPGMRLSDSHCSQSTVQEAKE